MFYQLSIYHTHMFFSPYNFINRRFHLWCFIQYSHFFVLPQDYGNISNVLSRIRNWQHFRIPHVLQKNWQIPFNNSDHTICKLVLYFERRFKLSFFTRKVVMSAVVWLLKRAKKTKRARAHNNCAQKRARAQHSGAL